jgi:hypothetical protein
LAALDCPRVIPIHLVLAAGQSTSHLLAVAAKLDLRLVSLSTINKAFPFICSYLAILDDLAQLREQLLVPHIKHKHGNEKSTFIGESSIPTLTHNGYPKEGGPDKDPGFDPSDPSWPSYYARGPAPWPANPRFKSPLYNRPNWYLKHPSKVTNLINL